MPLPFIINLVPPYILIQTSESKYQMVASTTVSNFGTVIQINASTTTVVVGNKICYNQTAASAITDSSGDLYYVLDENEIQFIEV